MAKKNRQMGVRIQVPKPVMITRPQFHVLQLAQLELEVAKQKAQAMVREAMDKLQAALVAAGLEPGHDYQIKADTLEVLRIPKKAK